MKRYTTVEISVQLAIDIFEANHIVCDTKSIYNRIYNWYNHSDITDPEILAACALEGMDWSPRSTYQEMLNAKERWFPQNPYDEISIWEIEAAQHDSIWW